ncbi:MAG: hypothetical protein SCK28_09065 [Bacillota bacterium]|nr:hypothetical protein [Bacillota bacterium]
MEESKIILHSSRKYVQLSHLIWLIIVFLLSIIFIITLTVSNSETAGQNLGFAATAVSIVLAVIAIVITLVDVAGQRNSIVDLKETSQKLQASMDSVNPLIKEVTAQISEIKELKEEMINAMQHSAEWREQVLNKFSELSQRADIKDPNELLSLIKTIVEDLEKKNTNPKINNRYSGPREFLLRDQLEEYRLIKENLKFVKFIQQHYSTDHRVGLRELLRIADTDLDIKPEELMSILELFMRRGYLTFTNKYVDFTSKIFNKDALDKDGKINFSSILE